MVWDGPIVAPKKGWLRIDAALQVCVWSALRRLRAGARHQTMDFLEGEERVEGNEMLGKR